ncbi:MAG: hypothetical protein ACTS6J_06130 [Burkholderiales bacterium]
MERTAQAAAIVEDIGGWPKPLKSAKTEPLRAERNEAMMPASGRNRELAPPIVQTRIEQALMAHPYRLVAIGSARASFSQSAQLIVARIVFDFFRSMRNLPRQESTGLSTESVGNFRRRKPEQTARARRPA